MTDLPTRLRAGWAALFGVAFFVGVIAGCDSEPPITGTPPCEPDDTRIVVGECFLGLTVYSDSADAVARLGPPDLYLVANDLGLRFMVYEDHPEIGGGRFSFTKRGMEIVSATREFRAQTAKGIGLGTPRTEVRQIYGEPDRKSGTPDGGGFAFYDFPADSVSFVFTYNLNGDTSVVNSIQLQSLRDIYVFNSQ